MALGGLSTTSRSERPNNPVVVPMVAGLVEPERRQAVADAGTVAGAMIVSQNASSPSSNGRYSANGNGPKANMMAQGAGELQR
jgi:hypothetical protein